MSTTAVSLRENRVVSFWRSTTGKKIVMAVTGAILFIFVIGHMLGNLQVFEGPEKINAYGRFLHNLGEILWAERIGLLAAVVLHITATVQFALRNKAGTPGRLLAPKSHQLLVCVEDDVLVRTDRSGLRDLSPAASDSRHDRARRGIY